MRTRDSSLEDYLVSGSYTLTLGGICTLIRRPHTCMPASPRTIYCDRLCRRPTAAKHIPGDYLESNTEKVDPKTGKPRTPATRPAGLLERPLWDGDDILVQVHITGLQRVPDAAGACLPLTCPATGLLDGPACTHRCLLPRRACALCCASSSCATNDAAAGRGVPNRGARCLGTGRVWVRQTRRIHSRRRA